MENDDLQFPPDMTQEEAMFIELVKQRMLQKLDYRRKFIFLYCIELGKNQRMAAEVLGVHETSIARDMRIIRERLGEWRTVKIRE